MQRFRRLFALLFILSLFVGIIHEVNHVHHQGDVCEVCVFSHAPGFLSESFTLESINCTFESFQFTSIINPIAHNIILRSRAPPLS